MANNVVDMVKLKTDRIEQAKQEEKDKLQDSNYLSGLLCELCTAVSVAQDAKTGWLTGVFQDDFGNTFDVTLALTRKDDQDGQENQ